MEEKQEFSSVWFATEKQIKNRFRFFNFSDRGSLNSSLGELHFKGNKHNIVIKNIKSIDVAYPLVPWGSLALALVFVVMFFGILGWFSRSALTFPSALMFVFYFVFFVPFVTLIQKIMLWVEVVYLDGDNILRYAYFFDGSFLGWRGILGGSLELYKRLREYVRSEAG